MPRVALHLRAFPLRRPHRAEPHHHRARDWRPDSYEKDQALHWQRWRRQDLGGDRHTLSDGEREQSPFVGLAHPDLQAHR